MARLVRIVVPCLLAAGLLTAGEVTKTGTVAAQFLKIGVGASAVGMGGAAVACGTDASAWYWNPALPAGWKQSQVTVTRVDWLVDTQLMYTGVALPLPGVGTIGCSLTSLSMDDMPVRTEEFPEGTGEYFSAGDLALGVAFARKLTDFFAIGFQGKYVQQRIWHCSASSLAFDFGTLYHSANGRLHLGAAIANFGSKLQYGGRDLQVDYDQTDNESGDNEDIPARLYTDAWDLPLLFRIGLAADVWQTRHQQLTVELDALHPNDNTEQLNLGCVYQAGSLVTLRVGYQGLFQQGAEQNLTAGAGLNYRLGGIKLHFDYAYADFGCLSNVRLIGLALEF